jgi:hypothetical protein
MKTKGLDQAELDQGPRQCNPARCVAIFTTTSESLVTSAFVARVRLVADWARVG